MGIRRGTATPTKIYRGTTPVKKVMRGTFEVWSATVTVTPAAPTFLAASPWVTLPTVAGVSYSVSGTPGYSQTVTVTATAQAGYELVGQTSWTHTYGPPPRYTAAGSGGARDVSARSSWETVTTHTVSSQGAASGQWLVEWRGLVGNATYGVRVLLNGSAWATNGPSNMGQSGGGGPQSVSIPEAILESGDSLQFQVYGTSSVQSYRALRSWSWSLS